MLVALGAMAALAVTALTGEVGVGGLPELATTVPGADAAGGTPGRPAGPIGAASAVACTADVATLETAMRSANAIDGTYPVSLTELVARGFVSELPARPGLVFAPEVSDGRATGRILVNGLPPAEGCR